MKGCIGIRDETKDPRERRAALTPDHVRRLVGDHGLEVRVRPSKARIFTDEEYAGAGARVTADLRPCNVVFGVKEVPLEDLLPGLAYCFFSHTIKGQPENMPMLRRMLELRDTLIDYELVKNERGRRVIAFGVYAGYAGMVNTLWALGRRLRWEGIDNPFERIHRPHRYPGLHEVREALREAGRAIRAVGLPPAVVPLVVGVTGGGRVARGALELLKVLPTERVEVERLPQFFATGEFSDRVLYRVDFNQGDLYEPREPGARFDHYRFHRYPDTYTSRLERYLPYLSVLVNGIFWSPRYPRLVTNRLLRSLYESDPNPRLRVIGDITCDVDGSIEATVRATTIDDPVFVYEPQRERAIDGIEGRGPVIMAVDKLPTELPRQASESFGEALMPFVPELAAADFGRPLEQVAIATEFREAVIAHGGELSPSFAHLQEHLRGAETRS